jgi:aryl-alcohol dehydrogenase-like predicted oxidoreductase
MTAYSFSPRRELGRTGFVASALGIGDIADRSLEPGGLVATLTRALDAGLNLIDTAPGYEDGYSEEIVGAALGPRRRDEIFLIDKIDHLDRPVEEQVDGSLRRLDLDHADLFVFHAVSTLESYRKLEQEGRFEELRACVRAGKTRFVGISSHHPDVLAHAIPSGLCDVVMFPLGPFVDRRYVEETLPLARRYGVGSVCFKTFGAGKLLGDTAGYGRPLAERPRGKWSSGGQSPSGDHDARSNGEESSLPRLSVSDCLAYTLTYDPDVTLLGLSFDNEQDAAFEAARTFRPLGAEELSRIRESAAIAIAGKGPCWWNPEP